MIERTDSFDPVFRNVPKSGGPGFSRPGFGRPGFSRPGHWDPSRRRLLQAMGATGALLTFNRLLPSPLLEGAESASPNGRILVVVEMAGGNDGLNTVVPYTDEAYQRARPVIGIDRDQVLSVTKEIGLHPSMRGFGELLDNGHLAIVQGVGYPEPNRSHFESMDIWHTCRRKNENREQGWLGRYLEAARRNELSDPPAIHLGEGKQPLALMSRNVRVPSVESLDRFRLQGDRSAELAKLTKDLSQQDAAATGLLDFVRSSTTSALATSQRMESVGDTYQPAVPFPNSGLGKKLETVSKLIASGLETRVYYVRIDGFDTHASQPDAHAILLRAVSDSVHALLQDAESKGIADRLLVMCFSEFGRRVAENASEGTDHGTAGPVFVAGTRVKAGLLGKHPSLSDLENGDLKHHTDFRQVYAMILEQWLEVESSSILGGTYRPVEGLLV